MEYNPWTNDYDELEAGELVQAKKEEPSDEVVQLKEEQLGGENSIEVVEARPRPRDRDGLCEENRVAVFFGCIPPHVHVKELKQKILQRGLKPSHIRWMGVRGYCVASFKPEEGLTSENAALRLRGICVGKNDKQLNVEPDKKREDHHYRNQQAKPASQAYSQRGTSEDDQIITYRPAGVIWQAKMFEADTQCRVFVGGVPLSCRASELREACESKGLSPAEVDASKSSSQGYALIYFDREEGMNSNILKDQLEDLSIRDGSVILSVQADTRSSRAEDRPADAPKPGEDIVSPPEMYERDVEQTPNLHRIWVGYIPYGISLGEFKREVAACGLTPQKYLWKASCGYVIVCFNKVAGVTVEYLCSRLRGIRVGTRKRELTVKPDDLHLDVEGLVRQEIRCGLANENRDEALEAKRESKEKELSQMHSLTQWPGNNTTTVPWGENRVDCSDGDIPFYMYAERNAQRLQQRQNDSMKGSQCFTPLVRAPTPQPISESNCFPQPIRETNCYTPLLGAPVQRGVPKKIPQERPYRAKPY